MTYKEFFAKLAALSFDDLELELRFIVDGKRYKSTAFRANGPLGKRVFIEGGGEVGCTGEDMMAELCTPESLFVRNAERKVPEDIADTPVLFASGPRETPQANVVTGITVGRSFIEIQTEPA